MRYIDTTTYDDYDRVVRFLLEHQVPIVERSKMKMVVVADLPVDLESKMFDEVEFGDIVSVGDKPLG